MRRHRKGRGILFGGGAARVTHNRRELRKKRLEAMDRRPVLVVPPCDLGFGARRAFGGRHRVARRLGRLILVGKEQFAPGLFQMPLDVVGEHAEEDVGAYTIAQAVMDGADLEVDGLHRPKRALDLREGFVMAHAACTIETFRCDRGADDINAIEGRLRGDGILLTGKGEARVGEREGEVLGHLVAVDHATDRKPDLVLPLQAAGGDAG